MMKSTIIFLVLICIIHACHYPLHGSFKRRKREVDEEASYDSAALINFFTSCMASRSIVKLDWYSVTEWTVSDSNWFYYSEEVDCSGEEEFNETICWLSRVDEFLTEDLRDTLKLCINDFALASNDTTYVVALLNEVAKRRKRNVHSTRSNETPRSANCPIFSRSDYQRGLLREIPNGLRRRKSSRQGFTIVEEEKFNITSVSEFVENYTVCSECERYTDERPTGCWPNRFDQLTRAESMLKQAIQRVNANYAGGGDIVGSCRGNVFWTEWFNNNNPVRGQGDIESLCTIRAGRKRNKVCENPSGIQARISNSNLPYGRAKNTLLITPTTGLICKNQHQINGTCEDFKVRFCCPDFVGKCRLRSGWTKYFDRSSPASNIGDLEILSSSFLDAERGRVCDSPTAAGVRLASGDSYLAGGEEIQIVPSRGLACLNALQPDQICENYKIRFCCSGRIGKCAYGHKWTKWRNSYSSRGDDETFRKLMRGGTIRCESNPSAIEAQVARTRQPYVTGKNKLRISPTYGLRCLHNQQIRGERCENYRVRFCCNLSQSVSSKKGRRNQRRNNQ